jgi:hypothetical protein
MIFRRQGEISMKTIVSVLVCAFMVCFQGQALAQMNCGYVGQEFCTQGQTYRCEKVGSEIGAIFQNRPCTVNVPSLNGIWRGTGHQSPAGSAGADWTIAMTIGPNGSSIDYPSLSCGGTLTQLSRTDTSAEFRESITYGQKACIDGGTITVRLQNGQLAWTWFGSSRGKQYNAIAVLNR